MNFQRNYMEKTTSVNSGFKFREYNNNNIENERYYHL